MTILVLKSSKLGPSLVFNILRIELVEFPLELVLCVNRIRSFPNVVKPTMPPNKGYILKEESDIGLLLGAILHSHCPKIGSESPKEVICLPCIPSPVEGRRSWCIPLWSGGYLDRPTVGHHIHAHLDLCQSLDPYLVRLNLNLGSLDFGLVSLEFPSLVASDAQRAWISLSKSATMELLVTCISPQ